MSCPKTIMAFADAMKCEPANIVGSEKVCIHRPPTKLLQYLAAFAPSSNCIIATSEDSPEMTTCAHLGRNEGTHCFLRKEGVLQCAACGMDICKFCTISMEIRSENNQQQHMQEVCFKCHAIAYGSDQNHIDMKTMICEIESKGVTVPSGVAMAQVIDLHESIVINEELNLHADDIKNVKYPLLTTEAISTNIFESKATGVISDLSRIVSSEDLSDDEVCSLMHLFAKLVTFEDHGIEESKNKYRSKCMILLLNCFESMLQC